MAVLQINILGTSFAITADEDLKYLEEVRDYYKNVCDKLEHTEGVNDPQKAAVLAGILIAEELFKERNAAKKLEKNAGNHTDEEANRITKNMIDEIDRVLK